MASFNTKMLLNENAKLSDYGIVNGSTIVV